MSDRNSRPDEAYHVREVQCSGSNDMRNWGIAVESPVEIRLNGSPWTVMLATPTNLEDLAVGLVLTERVVSDARAIAGIHLSQALGEYSVDLIIPASQLDATALHARSLTANSGCGLCGLESLAAFRARLQRDDQSATRRTLEISDTAVTAAFAALPAQQTINRATHSVHAAAWCTPAGRIVTAREDVGRHNALDKLVGARARGNHLGEAGFIVMSSRCSYELVYKAAMARASLLATISAPTTLALTWSETLGIPLACGGQGVAVVRFPQESTHAVG